MSNRKAPLLFFPADPVRVMWDKTVGRPALVMGEWRTEAGEVVWIHVTTMGTQRYPHDVQPIRPAPAVASVMFRGIEPAPQERFYWKENDNG
jgi:hypothetical protein